MIAKEHGKYFLECDYCGKYISEFDSFGEALDYSEESEWDKKKVKGEWVNICEDCK